MRKQRFSGEVLIVDGYNMIGAWPSLRKLAADNLEEARDQLIELLADYQGFSGVRTVIVFDAHQVPGLGAKLQQSRVEVLFTKEKETADECIERLVAQHVSRRNRISVATSDYVEQSVIFGQGALRVSARELLIQVEESRNKVRKRISENEAMGRNTFDQRLDQSVRDLFEQWRRGK